MTTEQLEEAAAKLEDLVAEYEKFQSTPIPDTIIDAIKAEWNLEPVHQAEFSGAQMTYHLHERRDDRKRLIRFGDAIQVLQTLEEALIDKMVRDELDVMIARIRRVESAFNWLSENWRNLGTIFDQIWDTIEEQWEYIKDGAPALIAQYTLLFSIPLLVRMAKTAVQVRDIFPAVLRKKALPQRNVERRYRRKVSRL